MPDDTVEAPPKIELDKKTLDDPNASSLYVSYNILSVLLSLCTKVSVYERTETNKTFWSDAIDTLVNDLGTIYSAWELVVEEQNYGMPIQEDPNFTNFVKKTLRRIKVVDSVVNDWTLFPQVVSLLVRFENSMGRIIEGIAAHGSSEPETITVLSENNRKRLQGLRRLAESYRKLYRETNAGYYPL